MENSTACHSFTISVYSDTKWTADILTRHSTKLVAAFHCDPGIVHVGCVTLGHLMELSCYCCCWVQLCSQSLPALYISLFWLIRLLFQRFYAACQWHVLFISSTLLAYYAKWTMVNVYLPFSDDTHVVVLLTSFSFGHWTVDKRTMLVVMTIHPSII